MSEYQLYHFKSIDRPLTEAERTEVSSWSSRTRATANSALFTYSYGDFRKDVEQVMERYFDAMLYVANWGTRRLIFRLPKELVDKDALAAYSFGDKYEERRIALKACKTCYLLEIYWNDEEGGDWIEEDDYSVDDLTPLRENILNGDFSALYLVWMQFAKAGLENDDERDEEEDEKETGELVAPPVPANFSKMTGALRAFVDFFQIDKDLVEAARASSPAGSETGPDFSRLIAQLSDKERKEWLLRLAKGEPNIDLQFKKRLQQLAPAAKPRPANAPSIAEMQQRTKAKEQERLAREKEAARLAHIRKMKQIAPDEAALWKSVEFNIQKAVGNSYPLAVETLKDLRDLAVYQDKLPAFHARMAELREQYGRRSALIKRFDGAGL